MATGETPTVHEERRTEIEDARELTRLAIEHQEIVVRKHELYAEAVQIIDGDPDRLRVFSEALSNEEKRRGLR